MVTKRLKVYAFIDSQNLNLGISKDIFQRGKLIYSGWNLDYTKFRKYLKNKFYAEKAFMFIGYIPKYKAMYENLVSSGFKLIYKQVVLNKRGNYKGNIDAELVLHSCKLKYDEYDQAVIVSGDGDFLCIYEFLKREGKLKNIIIPNSKSESSLERWVNIKHIWNMKERGCNIGKNGRRPHITTQVMARILPRDSVSIVHQLNIQFNLEHMKYSGRRRSVPRRLKRKNRDITL